MKEIEDELKIGFTSFYEFSLELIEKLSEENANLKFAVVNMQIALELFLKYYFVKNGQPEKVLVMNGNKVRFKDFSDVLNSYFSSVRWTYMKKKHLTAIMESRNAIVHRGKHNEWNEELANYLITCAFFIQGTLKGQFEETLIVAGQSEHLLSKNPVWRKGSENFAKSVADIFKGKVFNCPFCYSKAMVDKQYFNFDENDIDGFQCLTCLQDLQLDYQVGVIKCCACDDIAFIIDILNEQGKQIYTGCCISCDNKMNVRKCANCDCYYFPDMKKDEINVDGKYFCSTDCSILGSN